MGPGGPQSAALVISECQTGILDPAASVTPGLAAQAAERGIVARIAGLADAFRAAGLPVVHCHIAHRRDLAGIKANSLLGALAIKNRTLIAGTPDTLPPPELAPHPGDHVEQSGRPGSPRSTAPTWTPPSGSVTSRPSCSPGYRPTWRSPGSRSRR